MLNISEPPAAFSHRIPYSLALSICLAGLLLFLGIGAPLQSLNVVAGIWATELLIFLAFPYFALRWVGISLPPESRIEKEQFSGFFWGLGLGAANFFAFVVPLQFLSLSVFPKWLIEMFDSTQLFEGKAIWELGLLMAGVSIVAPFCEEFFFRGVVQTGLTERLSSAKALWVTSIIFSAFHLDPVGFMARLQLGILFGLLFMKWKSLWPAIGAHAANNLVSSVLFLAQWKEANAEAEPTLSSVAILSSAGLLAMAAIWIVNRASKPNA